MEAKSLSPQSKTFAVYGLVDPRNGRIRYVGKTGTDVSVRLKAHMKRSNQRNPHKSNWLAQLRREGLEPSLEILEIHDNEADCFEGERWNIATYRALGFDLTNLTDGGEGPEGMRHSDSAKKQMSKSHKGKVLTDTHRKNIARALLGKSRIHTGLAISRAKGGVPIVCSNGSTYESVCSAARELSLHESGIRAVLKGRRQTCGDMRFSYAAV